MKYLLAISLLLSGCSTVVPVSNKFPEAPAKIMKSCPDLKKLDDTSKLSGVSKTVTINYSTYYECALKLDSWIEWYNIQKKIPEGLK
jgi:uncharacterized protein YceK